MTLLTDIADDLIDFVDGLEAVTVRPAVDIYPDSNSNGHFDSDVTGWATGSGTLVWDDGMAKLTGGAVVRASLALTTSVSYRFAATVYCPDAAGTTITLAVGTSQGASDLALESNLPGRSGRYEVDFTAGAGTEYFQVGSSSACWVDDVSVRRISDASVASALRRDVSVREIAASEGRYEGGDAAWHIPASLLTTPPSPGAVITDSDGSAWIVLDVGWHAFDSRWRCVSRRLQITADNGELIRVSKASWAKGDNHAHEPTWTNFAEMLARVQPLDTELTTEEDRRHMPLPVEVYCDVPLPVGPRLRFQRLRDGVYEPVYYKVNGVRRNEQLGEKFVIDAEATPWPLA